MTYSEAEPRISSAEARARSWTSRRLASRSSAQLGLRLVATARLVELAAELLGRIDVVLGAHGRHQPAAKEVPDDGREPRDEKQPPEHAPMLQCPAELLATPCADPPGTGAEGRGRLRPGEGETGA